MIKRPLSLAVRGFFLFAFLLFTFSLTAAQSTSATLSGTVEDQNGAVIPGAAIVIQNVGTSLKRVATTNDEGSFTVPLLPPGTYTVTVRRDGFTPLEVRDVILNVGDQKGLRITLKAGDVNATVQVTSEAPLINTSPVVATTIDRAFVGNLPLNGRSFQSLILLTPGVTVTTGLDGGQFSVNGQRTNTNYFTIDGVGGNIGAGTSVTPGGTTFSQAGALPAATSFGGTNNLVSIDALEEFKIQTSSYSAEFGRQPGGQVTLVTRSGTNDFHGSLFEYFRNEALDARNYFNRKPALKPALRQNQFGGTFSGRLPFFNFGEGGPSFTSGKDRTFFFLSYEGLRLRLPQSGIATVPSLRLRQVAAPALRPLLNAFPIPTGPELLTGTGQPLGVSSYNYGLSDPSTMDAISIRVDHNLGGRLLFFGRFNEASSESTVHSRLTLTTPSVNSTLTRSATFGATWSGRSRLSNEFRINYSKHRTRSSFAFDPVAGAIPIDLSSLTTGYTGGGISVGQASISLGGSQCCSLRLGDSVTSSQRQFNLIDNISFTKGAHRFQVGIDYRRLTPIFAQRDYAQFMTFTNETAFVNGTINSVSIQAFQQTRPIFSNFSTYLQDGWKPSNRLTVDLGVRWELNPAPKEASGRKPIMLTNISLNDVSGARVARPDSPIYKTFYGAFAPRLGVAYQLNQVSGYETVLRGGFGVFYDLGSGESTRSFLFEPPFNSFKSLTAATYPLTPILAQPAPFEPVNLATANTVSLDQNLKLPYTLQWNVAIQQALGSEQALSVSYVAAVGRRLVTAYTLNQANPSGAPNPNFGAIFLITNGPTSDYHSMQVQYQARVKRGLRALLNYTWSHAIDEVSDEVAGNTLQRGNASFDVRHNLSAGGSYDLPGPAGGRLLEHVFNGWTMDAIVHAQSGFPQDLARFSAFVPPSGIQTQQRPDLVLGVPLYISDATVPGGRRFNPAAFRAPPSNRQGTFGRNVLRGLPIYQLDLALGRSFKFSENWKLSFKAEAFNVFNHPMFGFYGKVFTVPSTFGVASQTLNTSSQIVSPLYQLGGPRSIQFSMRLAF